MVEVGSRKISYLAFSGDVGLLSRTHSGHQAELSKLNEATALSGLVRGLGKCAMLSIAANKKKEDVGLRYNPL